MQTGFTTEFGTVTRMKILATYKWYKWLNEVGLIGKGKAPVTYPSLWRKFEWLLFAVQETQRQDKEADN
jgi:hypothetical protein